MSAYAPIRRPRLDGSVFAPELGLHLHVGLRGGRLARVGMSHDAHDGEPAPDARPILARLARHCATGREDLSDLPLDLSDASPFDRAVLETLVREVPPGRTVSYAELARLAGRPPGAARAVGGAMSRNPLPIVVPCHRVLPAGRRVGEYSGEGGWETKMRLLRIERAPGVWQQAQL